MTALPEPGAQRWQPLRIGLVDLFYYDAEEFWFRDGRLLLRGNNGTGKSKVLALTLPFLLDGDLSARRVEPDGDPKKRMEWNLLLGGEHPHSERLGYTWAEFGRRDEEGRSHFRTLVCGLKAVSGRGIARKWFAVTDQRVGVDLSLVDATGTALTRDRLLEAVTGHGLVYDQDAAYRRAVDEALFGLGERRYAALVDLLIQLRQPQLSKRPNEAALSKALTEALPPMDQAVVSAAAESFRSLDEEKEELRAAAEAERAASAFLDHYRRYAKVAARRRARLPRQEHSRYEQLHRDLGVAQDEHRQAEQQRNNAAERLRGLEETAARLGAQETALRARPEMGSARELEQAAADVERTRGEQERSEADHAKANALHSRARDRAETARRRLTAAEERVAQSRARARETARTARLDRELELYQELPSEGGTEAELRRATEESMARRRRTVEHLEELSGRAEDAEAERLAASRRVDEAETDVAHAAEQQARAEDAAREAGRALLAAVRQFADGRRQLTLPDPAGLLDRLQDWVGHLEGPYPARAEAAESHRALTGDLADEAAAMNRQRAEREEQLAARQEELAELGAGGQTVPPVPYTRTPEVRTGRPGAPLWRVVDFRPHLDAAQRAGYEAALEASGLLDAWVCPDGTALDADGHDILLTPEGQPAAARCLAEVLCAAVDHGDDRAAMVGEEAVGRLLAAIGAQAPPAPGHVSATTSGSASATWVAEDGRFRVGALTGSWSKPAAAYVGEGAREEARRTRMQALAEDIAALQEELARLRARQEELVDCRRALDADLDAVPDDDELRQAYADAGAAADTVRRSGERREARAAELADRARQADEARSAVTATAADVGLPADRAGLAEVREGLDELAHVLAELWPALRERTELAAALEDEQADVEAAGERLAELAERVAATARRHSAADAHHRTLLDTVGAAVAELERQLTATAEELRVCGVEQGRTRDAHTRAEKDISHAEGRIERLQQDLTQATEARTAALAALQRFAATGLLAVALPDVETPPLDVAEPWAAKPAIALARTIEAELSAADDSDAAWERVQRNLSIEYKKLQDALSRHGHTASARMVEDGMVVEIVYQGRERAVPELTDALTAEVAQLQHILSAHEREILETHLLTEVAGTLQELITAAERHVRAMNAELEGRPTSTGMTLRLVWRPARQAPAGLAEIRPLLRQSADVWAPEQRAAVGEFLQARIAAQQERDSPGSWLEQLTAALDYRSWHEFGVERHQNGRWVPATGPASGGERVLAVSVPLFAAASSHYASADSPYAPRLITLDEAFAGVDDDSRAKCLGLLHAFDLDVMMTSEREWACYPQVPGIAIAQLSRTEELAAVLVTRWEWDGSERVRGREPNRATAVAPPDVPQRADRADRADHAGHAGQEALWA